MSEANLNEVAAAAPNQITFECLQLPEALVRAVKNEGYEIPTPIQAQCIPLILEGRDMVGCAQTGTGKTAAFSLPSLARLSGKNINLKDRRRPIRMLVLCPTRELALQIGESLNVYGKHTGLKHAVIFGGVSQFHQVAALDKGIDMLVATPGRLLDLMNQGYIRLDHIELLVLDEADRMLDMGFIHDLKKIVARCPRERQTLLFSATMPESIRDLARQWLHNPADVRVAPVSSTVEIIEQEVVFVPQKQKTAFLAKWLDNTARQRTLVFTRTKHGADKVVRHLEKVGIKAEAIHGNKSQNARVRALEKFKSKHPPVLVATDIAARGLDVDGVSHVVNFDVPHEPETYVHRIGRTGRAGRHGQSDFAVRFGRAERSAGDRTADQSPHRIRQIGVRIHRRDPRSKRNGHCARRTRQWRTQAWSSKRPTPGQPQPRWTTTRGSLRRRAVQEVPQRPEEVRPRQRQRRTRQQAGCCPQRLHGSLDSGKARGSTPCPTERQLEPGRKFQRRPKPRCSAGEEEVLCLEAPQAGELRAAVVSDITSLPSPSLVT